MKPLLCLDFAQLLGVKRADTSVVRITKLRSRPTQCNGFGCAVREHRWIRSSRANVRSSTTKENRSFGFDWFDELISQVRLDPVNGQWTSSDESYGIVDGEARALGNSFYLEYWIATRLVALEKCKLEIIFP